MADIPENSSWYHEVIRCREFADDRRAVRAELCFPADFPAFAGHFPGQPVLPAVMQLAIVRMLSSDLLQAPFALIGTEKIKFKTMIGPGESIEVQVSLAEREGLWLSSFKLRNRQALVSSGAIILKLRTQ